MAFFKKELEGTAAVAVTPPGAVRSASAAPVSTYVAAGSHIEGSITGNAEVLVDGALSGEVNLDGAFALGKRGTVSADIVAKSVKIAGHVKGSVTATEKIELLSTGSVEGDMASPLVSIAEGGVCNGRIEMSGTMTIDARRKPDYDGDEGESAES